MSETNRYSTKLAFTHEHMMIDDPDGSYVLYTDHVAALAPALTPKQAAAEDMYEALTLCEGLVIGWAVHYAIQGCTTYAEYARASSVEGWHPTHRAIYEKFKAALAKAGKP